RPRRAAVPSGLPLPTLLADLDEAVLRARHRALDEQQVALEIGGVHREPDLRHALAAQAAGHAHALEDARGRGRRADRAPLADVVRAVRHRSAVEVVALDRPREALADRDPGDLHLVARLERLDGHRLAGHRIARAAQLDQMSKRAVDAVLREVPALGL